MRFLLYLMTFCLITACGSAATENDLCSCALAYQALSQSQSFRMVSYDCRNSCRQFLWNQSGYFALSFSLPSFSLSITLSNESVLKSDRSNPINVILPIETTDVLAATLTLLPEMSEIDQNLTLSINRSSP